MKGLGSQVAGTHYTAMKMQPIELAYKLYATPCFCKLAKYLTRDKGDKLENLKKARHCIQLEVDLLDYAQVYMDNLDVVHTEDALYLIEEFTDNIDYQEALFQMWIGAYQKASDVVDEIIQKHKEHIG
jgi:hypothetical protein